ncbi:hypothetical protein ABWU59_31540, partial [Priestia megaterium]|uniref:hypothetical protein n=1 Tax=Priestia megaterium TaxID=1404 RepID=UPI003391D34E
NCSYPLYSFFFQSFLHPLPPLPFNNEACIYKVKLNRWGFVHPPLIISPHQSGIYGQFDLPPNFFASADFFGGSFTAHK